MIEGIHVMSQQDATVLFDIDEFCIIFYFICVNRVAAAYLKTLIHMYSKVCTQFVIYNKKRVMTNLKSIELMMERVGYRRLKRVKSNFIATFVSKNSQLWKK